MALLILISYLVIVLQDSSKPYVAAIMGTCLGGGLEVKFLSRPCFSFTFVFFWIIAYNQKNHCCTCTLLTIIK